MFGIRELIHIHNNHMIIQCPRAIVLTGLKLGRRGACQGLGEGQGHKTMKFRIEPSTASKDGHFDDRYD